LEQKVTEANAAKNAIIKQRERANPEAKLKDRVFRQSSALTQLLHDRTSSFSSKVSSEEDLTPDDFCLWCHRAKTLVAYKEICHNCEDLGAEKFKRRQINKLQDELGLIRKGLSDHD
jgi:hypothetical protein